MRNEYSKSRENGCLIQHTMQRGMTRMIQITRIDLSNNCLYADAAHSLMVMIEEDEYKSDNKSRDRTL